MKNFRNAVSLLFVIFALGVMPAMAADATSFDPIPIPVVAKSGGGVPVGTIVAWPVAQNPSDWDKWLECNGQSVNSAVYPELFAVVGANVPDMRGLFLRGVGGSSAALGTVQGDAIRNIYGDMGNVQLSYFFDSYMGSGALYMHREGGGNTNGGATWGRMYFDASRVVPTAPENRPVNRAVRYLIRSRI